MGSVGQAPSIPQLTALERIGPKGYLRYVFPFQLQEGYDLNEIAGILQAGYNTLTRQIPEVACEAVLNVDWHQRGVFKWIKPEDESIPAIVVKDLRDSFPSSYAELKSKHFPLSSFDSSTICRCDVWPSPGERLPISLVQANFIPGGMILSWNILHMAGDGTSFYVWTRVWAEACRRAQGLDVPDPFELPDAIREGREQVMRSSGHNKGKIEDHPEYTIVPFTPTEAPPKMMSPNHRGIMFYFSPESLAALKAEASPSNATEPSDQKWISTNDALSALLWRTVMNVQSPLETLEGNPMSVFNISIDGRQRTDPPVFPATLGCFLEYVAVTLPIRDMLSKYNLADIAVQIRKALIRANDQFTDDVVTLVEQLEDVDRLVPTAFLDVPGFNCILSSWINFELYGLDWGSLLGHIEAVRTPSVGCINGNQVVMPVLPNGGMEILVGVEESCVERVLNDPYLTKYGVART